MLETQDDLIERLVLSPKPTVFVVGAAICAPAVPGSLAMVDRVVEWFERKRFRRGRGRGLRDTLAALPQYQRYPVAFEHLIRKAGVDEANAIVRTAVHEACNESLAPDADPYLAGWTLPPAVAALGRYAALGNRRFAGTIVTSNFDPLIEVAIRRAGSDCVSDVVTVDGHLSQRQSDERVRIVHVHGFWRGGDTLHSATQKTADRPRLGQALKRLFRGRQVVVLGYGGADDAILRALGEVAHDADAKCDVLWAFHGSDEDELKVRYAQVFDALKPAAQLQRALFYGGVDVHCLLPELAVDAAPRPFLDPDEPVARTRLFKHLRSKIDGNASVELIGEPYMGKSTIMGHMARMLRSEGRKVAVIDGRSLARTPAGFVQGIGDALGQRIPTWKRLCETQAVPDETAALAALKELLPCVVLVDDADELALPGHGFSDGFFDHLRPLVQNGDLVWVSASAQSLSLHFEKTGVSSPFLNDAESISVGALEPDVREVLSRTVPEPEMVDEILAEAGPHAWPLLWWAQHWETGSVDELRPQFRAWIRSLYDLWWPEKDGAILKAAMLGKPVRHERTRIVRAEFEARGLIHGSKAWRAYASRQ